jgi:hypothetical protein
LNCSKAFVHFCLHCSKAFVHPSKEFLRCHVDLLLPKLLLLPQLLIRVLALLLQ